MYGFGASTLALAGLDGLDGLAGLEGLAASSVPDSTSTVAHPRRTALRGRMMDPRELNACACTARAA